MVYVYCKRGSDSARALADAIEGKRLRTFDGMSFFRKGKRLKLVEGDCVVAWGEPLPEMQGIRVLNGATLPNKYKVALKLYEAGIPTIQVRQTRPASQDWFGRSNFHVGGNDLLTPVQTPDFWVKREVIVEEYRLHSFQKKSIRAGKKILRDGYSTDPVEVAASNGTLKQASSWIRSFDGGWRICYDNFQSKKAMRELAHKAVEALELDFGAVDIGLLNNGKLIVLEVNRAPGLEGGSIEQYAKHVKDWVNNASRGNEEDGAGVGESVQPVVVTTVEPNLDEPVAAAAPAPTVAGNVAATPINPDTAATAQSAADWRLFTEALSNAAVPNEPTPADVFRRLSRQQVPATGRQRVDAVPANGSAEPRQGVQAGTSTYTYTLNTGPFGTSRIFDVQRRRIGWTEWQNKYSRITDPATKQRVMLEADREARRGKLPYDPNSIPAQ